MIQRKPSAFSKQHSGVRNYAAQCGPKVYGILRSGGNYHYYNVIGDCIFDLTSEQFGDEVLPYEDNPVQSIKVHFAKKEKRLRYEYLKEELKKSICGR